MKPLLFGPKGPIVVSLSLLQLKPENFQFPTITVVSKVNVWIFCWDAQERTKTCVPNHWSNILLRPARTRWLSSSQQLGSESRFFLNETNSYTVYWNFWAILWLVTQNIQNNFLAFHKMGIKNHSNTFWREVEEFKHLKTLTVKKREEDEKKMSSHCRPNCFEDAETRPGGKWSG